MINVDVTFVYGESDWEGMYVNGKLVCEGHSLDYADVLIGLGINFKAIAVDQEWMDDRGLLPEKLGDTEEGRVR